MRSLLIVPATLSVLLFAGAAFADQGDHHSGYDMCVQYNLKLDKLLPDAHGKAATEAKALRAQGDQLCNRGQFNAGAHKLWLALDKIGIRMPG